MFIIIIVVYFVSEPAWKLLDTPLYYVWAECWHTEPFQRDGLREF